MDRVYRDVERVPDGYKPTPTLVMLTWGISYEAALAQKWVSDSHQEPIWVLIPSHHLGSYELIGFKQ